MTDQFVRVRYVQIGGNGTAPGRSLWLWCPACEDAHTISFDHPDGWTWDGNETTPTISPSILATGTQWKHGDTFYKPNHKVEPGGEIRCHSFVRAGVWQFLADCTHALAGQTAPMVPLPDWLNDDYVGGTA